MVFGALKLKRALGIDDPLVAGASPALKRAKDEKSLNLFFAATLRWCHLAKMRADKGIDDSLLRLAKALGLGQRSNNRLAMNIEV